MTENNGKKILVAMSGGVDSTACVEILKSKGYNVSGATMKLLSGEKEEQRIEKTQKLAEKLGIDFCVFDFSNEFKKEVIEAFAKTYIDGKTPNPCVLCNKFFKFGRFLEKATELGFDYIATGHYAKCVQNPDGSFDLKRSANAKKDQTYFLYSLTQKELSRVIFPIEYLGSNEKEAVREFVANLGTDNAKEKESQDICFVPDGNYMEIVKNYSLENNVKLFPGKFVDKDGKILGDNPGIERFTIGQRKGVGIALGGEKPLYVGKKDPSKHLVAMLPDELLYSNELVVKNPSFVKEEYKNIKNCGVKIRYAKSAENAKIEYNSAENKLTIIFEKPVRAITPGQYAVLYDGDTVLGGGEIE